MSAAHLDGYTAEHDEVLAALRAIGHPARGVAVQRDRGSALLHLGIGFPALRSRVKQGFSFSGRPFEQQLPVWDALWSGSEVGDVLFAALAWLEPIVRKQVPPGLWLLLRHWPGRLDNWCHADMLAGVMSRCVQADRAGTQADLQSWNAAEGQWLRRLSITSLVHYSGKNAVFLPPEDMLPLLRNCVDDHRKGVAPALGWVLRELGRKHPAIRDDFVERHRTRLQPAALRRALEARG